MAGGGKTYDSCRITRRKARTRPSVRKWNRYEITFQYKLSVFFHWLNPYPKSTPRSARISSRIRNDKTRRAHHELRVLNHNLGMIIPDPCQLLCGRNRFRPRREFHKRGSSIADKIYRIWMGFRSGSPGPEARERFVGEDAHCRWTSKVSR